MTLSYGGVEIRCSNAEIARQVEESCTLSSVVQFARHSWTGPRKLTWPWLGVQPHRPIKIGTLYWPNDAYRFAYANLLVSDTEITAIRALTGGTAWTEFDLVMTDGNAGNTITAGMYMLPPLPLAQISGLTAPDAQLHLLTLVDARFFWWARTDSITVTGGTTTWASLFGSAATAVGESLSPTVDADYLKPSEELTARYEYIPLLMDACAVNTGLRIIRLLDGTLLTQSPSSASTSYTTQKTLWDKQGGGLIQYDPPLPTTVKITFPVVDATSGIPTGGLYVGSAATSASPAHTGARAWHDSAASDGTNDTELDDLTTQFAADWLAWQVGKQATQFAGIVPYEPHGLIDFIEWHYTAEKCATVVHRGPWNHVNEQLNHYATPGSVSEPVPGLYTDGDNVIIPDLVVGDLKPTVKDTAAITTDQNDYALPDDTTIVGINADSDISITGFAAPASGSDIKIITNTGDSTLTLVNQSGSSSAANRLTTPDGQDIYLAPGESAFLYYDSVSGTWQVISWGCDGCCEMKVETQTFSSSSYDNLVLQDHTCVLRVDVTNASGSSLTGITAPSGSHQLWIINVGTYDLTLVNDSTSTAANRFLLSSGGNDTLATNHLRLAVYDPTTARWRIEVPPTASGSSSAGARVTYSGSQSVSTGNTTVITFDTETRDDGGYYNNGSSATALTVPSGKDGWHTITGGLQGGAASATSGGQHLLIKLNGTTTIADGSEIDYTLTGYMNVSTVYYLTAGDYVELFLQNSTDVSSSVTNEWFAIKRDA